MIFAQLFNLTLPRFPCLHSTDIHMIGLLCRLLFSTIEEVLRILQCLAQSKHFTQGLAIYMIVVPSAKSTCGYLCLQSGLSHVVKNSLFQMKINKLREETLFMCHK